MSDKTHRIQIGYDASTHSLQASQRPKRLPATLQRDQGTKMPQAVRTSPTLSLSTTCYKPHMKRPLQAILGTTLEHIRSSLLPLHATQAAALL